CRQAWRIIGFYTLSMATILKEQSAAVASHSHRTPRPLVLIGRLAVDRRARKRGCGESSASTTCRGTAVNHPKKKVSRCGGQQVRRLQLAAVPATLLRPVRAAGASSPAAPVTVEGTASVCDECGPAHQQGALAMYSCRRRQTRTPPRQRRPKTRSDGASAR